MKVDMLLNKEPETKTGNIFLDFLWTCEKVQDVDKKILALIK